MDFSQAISASGSPFPMLQVKPTSPSNDALLFSLKRGGSHGAGLILEQHPKKRGRVMEGLLGKSSFLMGDFPAMFDCRVTWGITIEYPNHLESKSPTLTLRKQKPLDVASLAQV